MANLIAYIPVLNQRHLEWFRKHPESDLVLIPQNIAEEFLPRLARNMSAIPTEAMIKTILVLNLVRSLTSFSRKWAGPNLEVAFLKGWILPDEDISHVFAQRVLTPAGVGFMFETIWARWDMTAVHKNQPVIPDVKVSTSHLDNLRMRMAEAISVKSPDWWRQIGAVAFDPSGARLVSACNTHLPNEYETYIFGDPRLNVDAGQKGKYTSIHSEQAVVALCAKHGISLSGASVFVTTFPCEDCARWLAFAGVKKVFFREGYSVLNAQEVLRSRGMEIIQVVEDPASA